MKISQKYKRLCILATSCALISAGSLSAINTSKSINATYRNIGITYNGLSKPVAIEPFLVEGSTYVPLRTVSEILGANVIWQPETNTVSITDDRSSITELQQQLSVANYKLTNTENELKEVKEELEKYKSNGSSNTTNGTNNSASSLKDTEDYLYDTFSDAISGVEFDFYLSESGSKLNVIMSYDSRASESNFNKASQRTIEGFMKKIGDNIAATHKNIEIEGTIEYANGDEEKAAFTRSKTGKYIFTYPFDEDTLTELVEDELGSSMSLGSEVGSAVIDSVTTAIRTSTSKINVKIYVKLSDEGFAKWDNLSHSLKERYVEDDLLDIEDIVLTRTNYDYDLTITLLTTDGEELAYLDEDSDISVN